ncbi:MAG TPA: peptidase S8 and S53 subtilisin kexin sedolisin [Pseudomonas sp.]
MKPELLVGVVDSGHAPQQTVLVHAARGFRLTPEALLEGPAAEDRLGHGTAVLEALALQPGAIRCCVAQVFAERWQTSPLQVAAAVHWLVEQGVALINLSLGLRHDRPLLRDACERALAAGVVLCAASPAQGAAVYPASYPEVLRISGDARCAPGQWSWLGSAQADFGAPVSAGGLAGASLACATLSGQIARYLHAHPGCDHAALLEHLRGGAAFVGSERRGRPA